MPVDIGILQVDGLLSLVLDMQYKRAVLVLLVYIDELDSYGQIEAGRL